MSDLKRTWWKENAVYQIYVRSFYDTNGDGVGDLNGVLQKIPYLKELGIKIVWLNPVYKTPDVDNGYDVSDYQDINEKFGTMKEFDVLLEEFHKNGIKVIMDLVVNHSSNQHPWFIESCKGNTGKKDWYIWTKTPNNWRSFFSGSVWKYDENRKEYYLHLFCEEQPDLNWENSDVRRAIYDMMHWWFKRN
ncbi:alpha-glucosidase [Entamoeba marina]